MSIIEKARPPAAVPPTPATGSDPQLNVILGALGVAFILGALIFSGSGQLSGLLFIVGNCLGVCLGRRGPGIVLLAGLVGFSLGLSGGDGQAWVLDIGVVTGAVMGTATTGSCALHRIPVRLATGAIVAGALVGYAARIAFP